MQDELGSKDPFLEVEGLLGRARDEIAGQVRAWQKAHQVTDWGYQLVHWFNEERQKLEPSGDFKNHYSAFASVSGTAFTNLAADLQKPEDPTVILGTSRILLSGLQSNVASYVSSPIDFGVKNPFPETMSLLEAQHVPLEDRLPALSRRIRKFSEHFSEMVIGVEQDLPTRRTHLLSQMQRRISESF